jgi:amino acid transporter
MLDMIGVGPFITLPLILAAMGGPQAMLGWVLGACLALCDGLVWAELGAAMPEAGGSYAFLRNIYSGPNGTRKLGRFLAFLFIFQLTFSAPLSVASGCIGLSQYATYLWPSLASHTTTHTAPHRRLHRRRQHRTRNPHRHRRRAPRRIPPLSRTLPASA